MSAALLKLERFDAPPQIGGPADNDVRKQQARAEAYAEGYSAGIAATSAKAGEREKLIAAIAALLETEAFDAPHRLQERAVGAVRVILETIFPTLSRAGFAVEAAAALSSLAKDSAPSSLKIATALEHAKALEILIKEISPAAAIAVKADPDITGAAAKAEWTGGGVEFDLDSAGAQCLAALESAIGKVSNGKWS